MFCRYCGEEIEDDSIFCTKCGKRLTNQNTNQINNVPETVTYTISTPIISQTIEDDKTYKESTDERENVEPEVVTQTKEKPFPYDTVLLVILIVIVVCISAFFIVIYANSEATNQQGTLYITSEPSGAIVTIGDKYMGITPLEVTLNPNTNYKLYLSKNGYEKWYQSVKTSPGEYKTISANMKRMWYNQPTYTQTPTPTPTYTQTNTQTYPSNEYYERNYKWTYNGREQSMTLYLSKYAYSYYKSLGHSNSNLAKYVTDTRNRETTKLIADAIKEYGDKEGYSESQEVMIAVAFVQALPYTSDDVTTGHDEYVRYPIETLVDYGGDCEDTAILTAAIIRDMGYGVVLLKLPGHVALGVKGGDGVYGTYYTYNGDNYFYLETTGENWDIGEIPEQYKNSKANIIYIP